MSLSSPTPLPAQHSQAPKKSGPLRRLAGRLSGNQTAFSATLLLMASSLLSGGLGLVRQKIIARLFGAGPLTDAYVDAFQLPDMLAYFLVGGVASISLVTMLSRFQQAGDEEGGDRALSIVLNAMAVVLGIAIVAAEFAAPLYTRYAFPKLADPDLCTALTRILLPVQLFLFVGGVLGSKLLVRRIFVYQALQPIFYNVGIIAGAVFLAHRLGIYSLAVGATVGSFAGFPMLSALGLYRIGFKYKFIVSLRHPAFREWLSLSVPLMVGVSLVTADRWILAHYASADVGAVTRINMAKTLFNAPIGILGQAAGAASLPFFSALFSQGRLAGFATSVNRAASRIAAVSLLACGWMVALATPIADLFRGGSFTRADAQATSTYFGIFSFSIALWTVQGIYARAFYAAGNTRVPAIAGWIVTLASIPVYSILFHRMGITGLALASDLGILTQTLTLAVLLHTRGLVPAWKSAVPNASGLASSLDWLELRRALIAGLAGFEGAELCVRFLRLPATHPGDIALIAAGTIAWLVFGGIVLVGTRSALPRQILRRG